MKPLIEKLHLSGEMSFVAETHRTPKFEVPWHQHVEYELILFKEGSGLSLIGNYVGEFEPGDVFFLGANLPHTFQKRGDIITSAIVVHFKEDFWGNTFTGLPECKVIKQLLHRSERGLKVNGRGRNILNDLITKLETETGFKRLLVLGECLDAISDEKEIELLSTQDIKQANQKNRERIDRVVQYTMENFKDLIQLSTVAGVADMSIPAFCNYFKKSTKKKYIDFLNEVRIGYACQLLIDTQTSIIGACYDSGFNTVANFNKQFMKIKGMTPSKYRKVFLG